MLHKTYLKKHKTMFFNSLIVQGKLYPHCAEVENQAIDMFDTLVEQMKEVEGITENLKEDTQMTWVCRVQNIEACAREIVIKELIYK